MADVEETREIVRQAVQHTLLSLGIDASTPGAVQGMQEDFAFIRRQRIAADKFKENALKTLLWLAGTGVVGLVSWLLASLTWKPHP